MLPGRTSNICFRCQLRLSRPHFLLVPFPSLIGSHSQGQPFTRRQNNQRRQFSSSEIRCLKIRTVSSHMSHKQQANLKPQVLPENLIGVYGRPGRQVLGESIPLNVERLGTLSDVIVLREGSPWSADHVPRQRAPTLRPAHPEVDILTAVKAETGLVMQSDVNANIEELRPQDRDNPLTQAEFWRIGKIIEEGFTNSQLQAYIRAYLKKEAEEEDGKKVSDPLKKNRKTNGFLGNGLVSKTDWYPNTTSGNKPFDKHPLRGYLTIQHTTKHRLVLDILRTCWKLDVKEVVESIGELSMQIHKPEFDLLTHPNISALGPILAKLYHDDGERIDAFKSKFVLRITANRKRALKIADEIEKSILDRIQKITINLSALKEFKKEHKKKQGTLHSDIENLIGPADETQIFNLMKAEVAKMTVTSMECSRNLATIFGVNESSDTQFASPAEIAKRLFISYYTRHKNDTPRMGLLSIDSSATEALVRYDNLDTLPWYDRLQQWVRRTAAARKSSTSNIRIYSTVHETSSSNGDHLPACDATAVPPEGTGSHIEPTPVKAIEQGTPSGGDIWCENYRTNSDVMLGQILHEKPNALPIEPLHDRENVRISMNQTFSTAVPNLPTLMESWRLNTGGMAPTVSETVTWQFEPSPLAANGLRILEAFPLVEMEFGIDEIDSMTRSLHLKEVNAFVQTTKSDVMLPDRPVDLRFQQRTTSRLLNSSEKDAEAGTPESSAASRISKFLEASECNLIAGIKTPSSLVLPMGRHLCKEQGAWKRKKAGAMDVEYIFTGMEIRKKMEFNFKGWTLVYTDISAGKAGGRRREVRLCPEASDSKARSEKDFIRAAFELADVVGGQESRNHEMAHIKWGASAEGSGHSEYFSKEVVPGKRQELGITKKVD